MTTPDLMKAMSVRFALPLPPEDGPADLHIAQVAKLWGLSQRIIRRWARTGMLPGRQHTDRAPYWFRRDDVATFAGRAVHVRDVRPTSVIRYDRWHDGAPCRVVEVDLVDGVLWRIGGRPTSGGDLSYARPCQGDRIVLLVPPGEGR